MTKKGRQRLPFSVLLEDTPQYRPHYLVADASADGGIIRGSETFIATGDTRIKPYDRAVIFALPTALSRIEKLFS